MTTLPTSEIEDILDEMKDTRTVSAEVYYRDSCVHVKNALWKISHKTGEFIIKCITGTRSTYWSIEAEFDVNAKTEKNEIFNKIFVGKFNSHRAKEKFQFGKLKPIDSIEIIQIDITVKRADNIPRLPSNYLDQLSNDDESSAVLLIEGRKTRVNKQFLSMHSPVFAAMFNETHQKEIPIGDCHYDNFLQFLRILHYQRAINIDFRAISEMLRMADFYQVQCVMNYCETWLIENLQRVSEKEIVRTMDKYKLNFLQDAMIKSTKESWILKRIIDSPGFMEVSNETQLAFHRALADTV